MIRAGLPALLLFAALATTPAQAQDSRLIEKFYQPDEVVTIHGKTKVQATIEFGEDEAIENVAVGDSTAWQVTPNKRANLLFVKPLQPTGATNMTVVTDKRTYYFDLVASPRAKPVYALRFTYPEPPAPTAEEQAQMAAAEPQPQASGTEMAAATDPFAVVDPASLNFEWRKTGENKLMPARIYDNGEAVFMTWPDGVTAPAIQVKDRKGTEGPVNYIVRDNTIIVDGVPPEIVLRLGEDSATLTYAGPPIIRKLPEQAALGRTNRGE
ncbi:TrbG/VirB9 family P-type conjugative transfer protein [Erythrobacter sp. LQ02-29]|uniref:TrbG/VirB9 family P-type conjugative transfer protein n=1 Tax=Erythrobacter sp. LQ02-29 TaxID=2920384 RepID=UPI001F4E03E2|nr:TrbG/VirB9 family P-type conjugative transfer protein [Erythrobacter sp. LQ02-29]MCP9222391.1 TrbG/VirB9 family P-type conjugative transfer protein [Erythrobacter sp. LQ02-29]